jgi:hypothetical protein
MKKKPPKGPDYEVGYGKPPLHSRFTKGQSGNPAGRAPGVPNTRGLIEKEGAEPITITENGIQKVVTKLEAAIKSLYQKALKGDVPALKTLLEADRTGDGAATAGGSSALSGADLRALRNHADWLEVIEEAERELEEDEAY